MKKKYTHIDLFSGIGGFSLGLKEAGLNIEKSYFSEIDKYAISVYKRNFPNAEYLGSVDTISGSGFKGRNTIITFGFPCQDLSVAGKRKGFDGSRSSLFFEAMRIIEEVRPSIFIFENVKGFYSSNNGKDFTIALQTIADIVLYECQWQLLNTAWFLPQNRERIYFVGSLGAGSRSKVFPIRENDFRVDERNSETAKVRRLSAGGNSGGLHSNMTILSNSALNRKWEEREDLPPLRSHGGCGHDNIVVHPILTPDRAEKRQNGRRIKKDKEPMLTLTGQDQHGVMISRPHGFNKGGEKKLPCLRSSSYEHNEFLKTKTSIRRLTPIECERLQGFPDNWTKYGHEGQLISDTQRYKMCGNAVSVPVVKAIGEKLNLPI